MMKKNNIYLILQGRIGNQLFQYALARKIQKENTSIDKIIIDDSRILKLNWKNSLIFYNLPNVEYVHKNIIGWNSFLTKKFLMRFIYKLKTRNVGFMKKYEIERDFNACIGKEGMFICENGYMDYQLNLNKPIYLEGYFQSELFFKDIKDDICNLFDGNQFVELNQYPGIEKLKNRNSVCISVKIEHNVGSSLYDVCGIEYWKSAIEYILEYVENPLFFICSDNVEYVLENLIDAEKYDFVVQDKYMPVHVSLAAMAECKHFIIGNTTFGWWAQYLSKNNDKIVVAPSRWMAVEMPIDIYQDSWYLIEV